MEVGFSEGEALRLTLLGIHRSGRQIPQASLQGPGQKQLPHPAKAQAVMLGLYAELQRQADGRAWATYEESTAGEEAADPEKI